MLIFKLFTYILTLLIQSLTFYIKKYRNLYYKFQSTYYSTTFYRTTVSYQEPHFPHLYYPDWNTFLPSWPLTHGNEQADKLVSFATPDMLYCTIMLAPYTKFEKFHTAMPRKSIIALLVDSYIFDPLHKVSILEDYNPMNYDKWM